MQATWLFPPHQPGYLAQDPIQRGFFTLESIGGLEQALIREAIQNALDARIGSQPVRVRIAWTEVEPSAYQKYFTGIEPHLKASTDGTVSLPDFTQKMSFLVIEDFNTSGLEGDPEREYIDTPESNQNFYYFWRNVGRTGKKEGDRGRWGLGKTVFPASSMFSTFFGLTCRQSDGHLMLMGQSVLKHHAIGKQHFTPYGYFGLFKNGYFSTPVSAPDDIEVFRNTFGLVRKDQAGLSIVVPAPDIQLTPYKVAYAALVQYFYPILIGDLQLNIQKTGIHSGNLEKFLQRIPETEADLDKETFARRMDFVRWSLALPSEDFVQLSEPDRRKAPDWKTYITEEQLLQARERFDQTNRVALRVGMKVEVEKTKTVSIGWFKVFIERDSKLGRAESHFLRNGIRLVDVKGHSLRGIRAMVVVDEQPLTRMLGDAENPAHTEWQKDTPSYQKYKHGPSSLSFIKNSLSFLAGKLTEAGKVIEKDLLKDIFFVEELPKRPVMPAKASGDEPNQLESSERKTQIPDLPVRERFVESRRCPNGLEIFSTGSPNTPLNRVKVVFAYEVRTGNPFAKYDSLDFDLSEEYMHVDAIGVVITSQSLNILTFDVIEDRFKVQITGFDGVRDVVVKLNWEGDSE